ncbi:histidine kinase dimerization/phosphoacceptor domain -containing protein [Sphingomonas sp. PB2P19]|uniref:histidine kinase dimerization/phosphoacceptor domain -containing protein n=1 Tax=Sphingomonas rhamnosi TaxID=3096156 RepID=UPI002FCBFA86
MTDETNVVQKLRRQQAAIAAFGTFALREPSLSAILHEAVRVCAQGLDARFSKICRYRQDKNDLVVEAGYGWDAGVIGFVVPHPDARTPQGQVFSTGKPFICNVLEDESKFMLPPFYAEHGIVSTIGVLIIGHSSSYGVLEIDSSDRQDYDQHDIDFLTGFANVLGEAVATSARIKKLADTVEEMKILVDDKNKILDQKKVLAEELQHRVRNNLQLLYAMLSKQVEDTTDEGCRRGLKSIARRVFTLAQVYDQLVGSEMTRTIDFCSYLKSLCDNIVEVRGSSDSEIKLTSACVPVMLNLDVVTSLGIIVTELVTNSFDHAFSTQQGLISLSLEREANARMACMTIRDNGPGFVPKPTSKRHGLGLVHRLSEQIGGSAVLSLQNGTLWTITFPVT